MGQSQYNEINKILKNKTVASAVLGGSIQCMATVQKGERASMPSPRKER